MSHFEKFLVENSQETEGVRPLTAQEVEDVAGAAGTHPDTHSMHICGTMDVKHEK